MDETNTAAPQVQAINPSSRVVRALDLFGRVWTAMTSPQFTFYRETCQKLRKLVSDGFMPLQDAAAAYDDLELDVRRYLTGTDVPWPEGFLDAIFAQTKTENGLVLPEAPPCSAKLPN